MSVQKKVQNQSKQTRSNTFAIWFGGYVIFDQGLGLVILEVFPNLNDPMTS